MIRVWEHEVLNNLDELVERIHRLFRGGRVVRHIDWRVIEITPAANPKVEVRHLQALRNERQVRLQTGPQITECRRCVDTSIRYTR